MELTQQNLKTRFKYDPETGTLFRLKRDGSLRKAGWNRDGYTALRLDGKTVLAHRIIWIMEFGYQPEAIDHLNGDRADNRIQNLRSVTVAENNRNVRLRKDNKSGAVGVSRAKYKSRDRGWRATIAFEGKDKHIGFFRSLDEAIEARKRAQIAFGFHENHGRI